MTVEQILTPIIEQEFAKYERDGDKVKLRSVKKKRIIYTLICLIVACISIPIALVIYIVLMLKTSKVKIIISRAKKYPNTPVEELIEMEMKPYQSKEVAGMLLGSVGIVGVLVMGCVKATEVTQRMLDRAGLGTQGDITEVVEEEPEIIRQEENVYFAEGDGYVLVSCGSNYMSEERIVVPQQYLGKDIVAIGEDAFSDFANMKSVEIPGSVKSIGKRAFQNCVELASITIPEGVEIIDSGAFMGCSGLRDISFSSTVSEIGGECFKGCSSLGRIEIPTAVTEIRGNCFENCTALTEVVLHDDIEAIHGYAFTGCRALEEITLPTGITEVRGNTFENCTSLRSIKIPEGVVRIGGHAFHNCPALSEVYVPGTVTEIGSSAFRECDSLEEIVIPKAAEVNERAFKDSPTRIYYN